jgi:4-hydroxybenzoate polyprenyltransferase
MMNAAAPGPFWKHIIDEAVLGNRGLTKLNGLWLPLALILTLHSSESPRSSIVSFFGITGAAAFWLLAVILANDIADRPYDSAVGRIRWVNRLPGAAGILLIVFWAGLGLAVPVLLKAPRGATWSVLAASAAGFAYSLRPLRFKERGLWGFAVYGLSCVLGYILVPWAWLGSTGAVLLIAAPAVFLDKWTNLHFHQVSDFDEDLRSGTRTYAIRMGLARARRTLRIAAGFASLALSAVFIYTWMALGRGWRAASLGLIGAFISATALTIRRRRRSPIASPLIRELPWGYLVLTQAVLRLLPLLLLVRIAVDDPPFLSAAATAAVFVTFEAVSYLRSERHLGGRPSPA